MVTAEEFRALEALGQAEALKFVVGFCAVAVAGLPQQGRPWIDMLKERGKDAAKLAHSADASGTAEQAFLRMLDGALARAQGMYPALP
jgi:hypothetical protein